MKSKKFNSKKEALFNEFLKYEPWVFKTVYRSGICNSCYLSTDDIVQDVYLKLCVNIDNFDTKDGSIFSYLKSITYSVIVGHIIKFNSDKRKIEYNTKPFDDLEFFLFDHEYGDCLNKMEEKQNQIERIHMVQSIFEHLKPQERKIVYNRFFKNKTMKDIGKKLNVSKQWVSIVLKKIQKRLRIVDGVIVDSKEVS